MPLAKRVAVELIVVQHFEHRKPVPDLPKRVGQHEQRRQRDAERKPARTQQLRVPGHQQTDAPSATAHAAIEYFAYSASGHDEGDRNVVAARRCVLTRRIVR